MCICVLSDRSFYWIPYYTRHMDMDTHPYGHHRNFCIQHSIHKVVHCEHTGINRNVK
jgi:hypothetical protein